MALVIAVLVMPAGFFEPAPAALVAPPPPSDEPIRFVHMEPLVDRTAPPPPEAPLSDLDRQAATIERPPDPIDPGPVMQGNTPERFVGAPEERAAGVDLPSAPPAPTTPPRQPPDAGGFLVPDPPAAAPPVPRGSLGDSLRDFQRYLNDQNFDNLRGGQAELGPDIQFDSRGIDFGPWIRRFRAQVYSNWSVPRSAMQADRVVVQFDLYKNGRISNVRVVRPSSVQGFNIAARNAIQRSNPTLPLPVEYPVEPVEFTVTFFYDYRTPPLR